MLEPEELLRDCDVRAVRRSGPGGQHRNKVETGVVLVHRPTETTAEANERRSRSANHAVAVQRLRVRLAVGHRIEFDREPTPLWRERCRNGRIRVNPDHADFPALLAEVLDRVHRDGGDVRASASHFGCSTSQLTKFLGTNPLGLAVVNEWRATAGLGALR